MSERWYVNARIYTGDPTVPWAEAMIVSGGRIGWLGPAAGLGTGIAARLVDLEGGFVLPGLTDAHVHLLAYALLKQRVDLRQAGSGQEALEQVAAFARADRHRLWILGHGWNENHWLDRRLPSRQDLDAIVPDRPVVLSRADYHLLWVNTRALEVAGIGAGTLDPPGGQVDRDAEGRPTGILRERACDLVYARIPEPALDEKVEALRVTQAEAHTFGLVGVHTVEGAEALAALQSLRSGGELTLRVLVLPPADSLPHLRELALRPGFGDEWLRLGQLKLFADGSLGSHTAWMLAPFVGEPSNSGIPIHSPEELTGLIREAHAAGWPCAAHAIGDAANRAVLDALECVPKAVGPVPDRIEHVQIIHPDDMPRLARIGVVASMQPVHVATDWPVADRLWGERARCSYAWRSLLRRGATLAFGSDAPVEPLDPWPGLRVALTRQDLSGEPAGGWHPEERLTLVEAIAGFTTGAARAAGEPGEGRLVVGARADFIVLERDPFALAPEELGRLRPVATVIGGREVFSA